MLATLLRPDAGIGARARPRHRRARPTRCAALVSLTGQLASVDEDLTGRENLILLGRLLGLKRAGGEGRARRAARGVRPRRGRRPAGQELLRRHAPPARHRREHRRHARADVPRRADDGPRPALAQPGLGHHPRARRRGHDDPALHAVPRRGRPARRRDRRDRPRQGDRRGHAGPAQGVGRLRRAARAAARPRAARRGRAGARRASSAPCTSSPTRRRSRSPCADADRAAEAVAELSRAGRRRSPTSRSASRASTRSSWR